MWLSVANLLVPESFVLAYASGHDVPINLQQNKCAFLCVLCVFCIDLCVKLLYQESIFIEICGGKQS